MSRRTPAKNSDLPCVNLAEGISENFGWGVWIRHVMSLRLVFGHCCGASFGRLLQLEWRIGFCSRAAANLALGREREHNDILYAARNLASSGWNLCAASYLLYRIIISIQPAMELAQCRLTGQMDARRISSRRQCSLSSELSRD